MKRLSLILALLLPQLPFSSVAYARASSAVLSVSAKLGEDAFEHQLQASVSDSDGELIVVKKRPVGAAAGPWRLWIWTVGPTGNLSHETALNEPNQLPSVDSPDVSAITRMADGSLIGVLITRAGELRLARITGDSVAWTSGNVVGANLHILKVVPTSDGNLILMGHRGGRPVYLKLTMNGIKVWEHTPESDSPGIVFDGIPTSEGGAFLVADYWNGDPYMIGDSSLWIARIDADGKIVAQRKISGRRPRLTSTDGDGFVLIYDQSNTVAQKVALQEFSGSLEPAWTTLLLTNPKGLETFKIVKLPSGGYAVAGGDDLKMFVSLIGTDGKKIWDFKSDTIQSSDFNLVAGTTEFIVTYPLVNVTEVNFHKQLNTKIQVSVFKTVQ